MANTFTAFFDTAFTFTQRVQIGQEIISYIQRRTKSGKGIGNTPFKGNDGNNKYSANYKEHRDFKAGGKTGQSTVNLTLTGDMLDSLEIIDASIAGRVIVGYPDGEESQKSRFMRDKGYNFMGLSDSELNNIVSNFTTPTETQEITRNRLLPGFSRSILRNLLGSN